MPRHIVVKLLETKEQEKILQTEKSDLLHREQSTELHSSHYKSWKPEGSGAHHKVQK